jgi:hydrogenase/urease accessory protein HupE
MTRRLLALATVAAFWPTRADAHLVTTGLGPLYDGVSHVLLSPDDLLPVLALGLLAGLNGPAAGRRALFVLPVAWLIGGAAGLIASGASPSGAPAAGSFLVLGVLTASDRRLSPALVAAIAAALGLLHGWLNGVAIADAQREGLGLMGIAGAIFVLVALAAAIVVSARPAWARVVVRVAGSWVAAIGLLMLGWSLRGAV